jgi:hypothetical protein
MRNFPRIIRPSTDFTPFLAGELAAVLAESILVLQDWRLPVRTEGRLRAAEKQLRAVAARASLGDDPVDLARTARSAAIAADFYQIAISLSDTREDPIAKELSVALGGNLAADSKDTSAYEIQSQFWVGVLLAQSGLRPAMPIGSGRLPDFVVKLNALSCGVEVKRPRSANATKRVLGDAAEQLNEFGAPGIIAVDLSAVLKVNSLILPRAGVSARETISTRLYAATDDLGKYIHRYERSAKFQHTIAMLSFARYWVWSSLNPPISDAQMIFTITIFPKAYSGLLVADANRLQNMLLNGIESVTGNPVVSAQR